MLHINKWIQLPVIPFIILLSIALTTYPHPTSAGAASALPYDDIRPNYAQAAIINMTKNHIMNGMGSRQFAPLKPITRAEFITMIDRLLGVKPVASPLPAFADVPKTAWYYEWIQSAVQLNIAKGTTAVLFEPSRSVTREEAAVIMARALKQTLDSSQNMPDKLFLDQDQISAWAKSSVYQLSRIGLIAGNEGHFLPQDLITRQEAAVLLNRAWTHSGWTAQLQASQPSRIQLGWQYGQTTKQFEQQVAKSEVNTLSSLWFYLSKAGSIEDHMDASLLTWSHEQGKSVWAMVGNHSDQVATHTMLASQSQRQAFVSQLATRVRINGIDGLNIDFENMLPEDRDSFTAFIKALHDELKAIPAVLSVNVSPDSGTDWTDVFDYAALAKQSDYIVLMGYDEHWGGHPEGGSVSSLPWVRKGLETLLMKAPANKVILALPLYTRSWAMNGDGTIKSHDISLVQQNQLVLAKNVMLQWDDQLSQYYGGYYDSGVPNRMWLEDGRSLSQKISLGEMHGIAGYGYWYMGGESNDVWTSVHNAIRFSTYRFS
ncbi:S-layer homology domain-containing protein [Paenibacillus sp. OV219]|uniref:S-layer homology domain-containing protein n=1 Tax=Paenibacillus sp. OV219 TaxID=1884377 RepID=UPI0008BDDE19|nr:S-layer homology domain-containing protein [Paenibacillus sp. OV219]SEM55544.1 S-layer homology domain-containing protein [Paenibacillus sp. OV219]